MQTNRSQGTWRGSHHLRLPLSPRQVPSQRTPLLQAPGGPAVGGQLLGREGLAGQVLSAPAPTPSLLCARDPHGRPGEADRECANSPGCGRAVLPVLRRVKSKSSQPG